MQIIRNVARMRSITDKIKYRQGAIGFVPTMGALHEGHLSLFKQARKDTDTLVASIFINPTQFGPGEDFKRYPRNFKKDCKLMKQCGVDYVFYPNSESVYPEGFKTYIEVKELSDVLCGKRRIGHFIGVATVVAKLLNIIQPDVAYFGQKDAQQAIIIIRMVNDLNIPVRINILPTVREKDGLAMSSRNAYLNKQEREDAGILFAALNHAKGIIKAGERNSKNIVREMKMIIRNKKTARIEYVQIVNPVNLQPVETVTKETLIVLAVWIGKTRLIDNFKINIKI